MVAIEGENMRQVTWVKIEEVPEGQWGIGGTALTGGRFYLLGSMVGALLIQTLTTTMLMQNVRTER